MDDLKCMKRVLRRLGYCNEQDVIDTKGKIACILDTYVISLFTRLLVNQFKMGFNFKWRRACTN